MAKKKSNAGRPTLITELVLKKLEEAFAMGCTDLEACLYADISHQTLYNYQNKTPEFVERKQALKNMPVLKARTEVMKGLNANPEFSLKVLERIKKDEFSLRQEITGEDGKEFKITINRITKKEKTDE